MTKQNSAIDANKQFSDQNNSVNSSKGQPQKGQPNTNNTNNNSNQPQHQQDAGRDEKAKQQTGRPAPDGTSIGNQQGNGDRQSPGQR